MLNTATATMQRIACTSPVTMELLHERGDLVCLAKYAGFSAREAASAAGLCADARALRFRQWPDEQPPRDSRRALERSRPAHIVRLGRDEANEAALPTCTKVVRISHYKRPPIRVARGYRRPTAPCIISHNGLASRSQRVEPRYAS